MAAGLIYGQVKKCYRRRKLTRVIHVMHLGTEAALTTALQGLGLSGRLNTAFIERVNLTVRHGVAALARRTWATAQLSPHLLAHLEWWRVYYHFVRSHAALRVAMAQPQERGGNRLAQCYRQRTPAMAAGRTNRRWTSRGSPVPLAACFRLRGRCKRWIQYQAAGGWMNAPAAKLVWSLTLGRAGPSGLPLPQKPARRRSVMSWSICPPCPMAAPVLSSSRLRRRFSSSKAV